MRDICNIILIYIYINKIQRFINWQRENVSFGRQTIINMIKKQEKKEKTHPSGAIRDSLIRTEGRERYKKLVKLSSSAIFNKRKLSLNAKGVVDRFGWLKRGRDPFLPGPGRPIWNLNPTSASHLIEQQSRTNTYRTPYIN